MGYQRIRTNEMKIACFREARDAIVRNLLKPKLEFTGITNCAPIKNIGASIEFLREMIVVSYGRQYNCFPTEKVNNQTSCFVANRIFNILETTSVAEYFQSSKYDNQADSGFVFLPRMH